MLAHRQEDEQREGGARRRVEEPSALRWGIGRARLALANAHHRKEVPVLRPGLGVAAHGGLGGDQLEDVGLNLHRRRKHKRFDYAVGSSDLLQRRAVQREHKRVVRKVPQEASLRHLTEKRWEPRGRRVLHAHQILLHGAPRVRPPPIRAPRAHARGPHRRRLHLEGLGRGADVQGAPLELEQRLRRAARAAAAPRPRLCHRRQAHRRQAQQQQGCRCPHRGL